MHHCVHRLWVSVHREVDALHCGVDDRVHLGEEKGGEKGQQERERER